MDLPRITIFSLGGTIASTPTTEGRPAKIELDAESLLAAIPEAKTIASVKAETLLQIGSVDLGFQDMIELAARIRSEVVNGAQGIVVTQGTDTLEETAFLLDRLVGVEAPVVVTGAMRHSERQGADGPANLICAIRVAASPSAKECGVLVVLNDEIHLARFVFKSHAVSTAAFQSFPFGPIGNVAEGRVRIPLKLTRKQRVFDLSLDTVVPQVALMPMIFDGSVDPFEHVLNGVYGGAVIQAFGAGHASSHLLKSIARIAQAMPTIYSSGTVAGETHIESCDFPGSELRMIERGLIPAYGLSGRKARLLLTLLLAQGAERREIEDEFARSSS